MPEPDQALWSQINRADPRAFEALYHAHFARVRNFLHIYLSDPAVVEDLAQDTFLQFWQAPDRFNPDRANLRAYLFGIARKKAADWWRQHEKNTTAAVEPSAHSTSSALLITDALQQLPPDLRNVLWLREVEGYSYDELAAILEIPVGTIKSRLFTAREQLRRVWKSAAPIKETV